MYFDFFTVDFTSFLNENLSFCKSPLIFWKNFSCKTCNDLSNKLLKLKQENIKTDF